MDGVFVTAGVALTLTFAGPGPGIQRPPQAAWHAGAAAVSWPMPRSAAAPFAAPAPAAPPPTAPFAFRGARFQQ